MDARNVPVEYSYRWILCSIEISKKYYSLFLGCGLLILFSTLAVSLIPFIGGVACALMNFLYGLGTLQLVRQIMKTEKATFDDFLKYTFDPIVFDKFVPFLVIIGLSNVVTVGLTFGNMKFVVLPWSVLSYFALFISEQAAYMMLLKPELSWKDALTNVLKGSWMNVLSLICASLCISIFAFGSALMCGVGLFLYFIPMTVPVNYLVFSSIYEGLDILETTAAWSRKSLAVQTITPPSDQP